MSRCTTIAPASQPLTVAVPVVAYLMAGDRLDPTLDRTKAWLIGDTTAVMALLLLLLVFGVCLLGDGLQILLSRLT